MSIVVPEKIIFLDMDGVMNSDRDFTPLGPRKGGQISTRPVGLFHVQCLREIIEKTGAKIVISSVWRIHWTPDQFNAVFEVFGLPGNHVISRTPREPYGPRGKQINAWINEHNAHGSTFIILDDDADMEPHMDRLIKTQNQHGLGYKEMQLAIEMLGVIDGPLTQ